MAPSPDLFVQSDMGKLAAAQEDFQRLWVLHSLTRGRRISAELQTPGPFQSGVSPRSKRIPSALSLPSSLTGECALTRRIFARLCVFELG